MKGAHCRIGPEHMMTWLAEYDHARPDADITFRLGVLPGWPGEWVVAQIDDGIPLAMPPMVAVTFAAGLEKAIYADPGDPVVKAYPNLILGLREAARQATLTPRKDPDA